MRSIPWEELAEKTRNATMSATMIATERDHFTADDYVIRENDVVFLAEQEDRYVAFTTRYLVDLDYAPHTKGDLFGEGVWARRLYVKESASCPAGAVKACSQASYPLLPTTLAKDGRFQPGTAYWQPIEGNHDAALVFIPKDVEEAFGPGSRATLELEDPEGVALELLRSASNVFGFKYVLISERALAAYKEEAQRARRLEELGLAFIAVGIVGSVLSLPAGKVIEAALSGSSGQSIAASALGAAGVPHASDLLKIAADIQAGRTAGALAGSSRLMLAELGSDKEQLRVAADFVKKMGGGETVQEISFGTSGAQFVLPERHSSINYELVRQGIARLDLDDAAALETFPVFIQAALDALTESRGFTPKWKDDAAYERALRAALKRYGT